MLTSPSYRQFAYRVRRETRFIRTADDEDFLHEVLRTSKSRIKTLPAETGLWRAQLGHVWEPFYHDDQYINDAPAAYPPDRMKPIHRRATEGRANPKGIPVLYLSTHPKIAMSAARPGPALSRPERAIFRSRRIIRSRQPSASVEPLAVAEAGMRRLMDATIRPSIRPRRISPKRGAGFSPIYVPLSKMRLGRSRDM